MRILLCCYFSLLLLTMQMEFLSVQGYTLMKHLAQQANALEYGLKLASKSKWGHGHGTRVAFTAVPSSTKKVRSGNYVYYNSIITNEGQAFKNGHYFQAPHDGLYAFTWSTRPYSTNQAQTSIRVNKTPKQYQYCFTGTSSYTDSCSTFIILSLSKGDKVSIHSDSSSTYIHATYSSFSGMSL
ncbi:uncharacterized protein LOC134269201 [Saccostrea cucullata]|uniref:uncharacterized protein LOC134239919 n=1 Tax=Saccostrea cuccullata TaxID=36930 RepID=UPI002ED21FC5